MGKNFPLITTLKEKPQLLEKTLKLIEECFHYGPPFNFKNDFAPLMAATNHHNCFILIDENENVLSHVGVKESFLTINNKKFPLVMVGGIAVDEKFRGEGHFQTLFQDVLAEKRSDTALFLLWSDLEKLYNKFSFHLCGQQFELDCSSHKSPFEKTKFHELTSNDKEKIKELYLKSFSHSYMTLDRLDNDWENIALITSADLYIRKSGEVISDYFFMNKGQDLPGIIYEYGGVSETPQLLKDISGHGKVWMGKKILSTEQVQYQFLMAPGDIKLFGDFILAYTAGKISLRNINIMKQEVFFDYNEELHSLELPDFLRGIFGPGSFEELELKPLFISGLDSI